MPENLDPVDDLLMILDLKRLPIDREDSHHDLFEGISQFKPDGRVFGGQVLAQSIVAATRTVEADRGIHSLHGYFLRAGDIREPITFGVERLRDGGSFSARRVHAFQHGKAILSLITSFQTESDGIDHQDTMPEGLPDPESLPSAQELLGHIDHPYVQSWINQRPMDIRHVDPSLYVGAGGKQVAEQTVWMRATKPIDADPGLHAAILAYASDYSLLEPILRRHGVKWLTPGLKIASLDHAMWWHRPVDVGQWLAYVQTSPSAGGGRGLSTGRIFTTDGTLVATVAQEGMVRVPLQD
ncbi:acyl-CoA thioesterase II [Saxibacter everestensis]|uniref:Acyl-CoA thioesterase II n=1 Tax=Saxibacter everestensis TaxID=2909229 RepID=A0ABY8QNB2_9MICO|nr:acyl-CoA thioesterase II [Brevibacteriaceae bacterium ZFBP1038]